MASTSFIRKSCLCLKLLQFMIETHSICDMLHPHPKVIELFSQAVKHFPNFCYLLGIVFTVASRSSEVRIPSSISPLVSENYKYEFLTATKCDTNGSETTNSQEQVFGVHPCDHCTWWVVHQIKQWIEVKDVLLPFSYIRIISWKF